MKRLSLTVTAALQTWKFDWKKIGGHNGYDSGIWYAKIPDAMWEPSHPSFCYIFLDWTEHTGHVSLVSCVDESKAQSIIRGASKLYKQYTNRKYAVKFFKGVRTLAGAQQLAEKLAKSGMPYDYFNVT